MAATKNLRNKLNRLRNIVWYMSHDKVCCFCNKRFTDKEIRDGLITIHHVEGTKRKKDGRAYRIHRNLEWSHPLCHRSHEMKEARERIEEGKRRARKLRAKGVDEEDIRDLRRNERQRRRTPKGNLFGGSVKEGAAVPDDQHQVTLESVLNGARFAIRAAGEPTIKDSKISGRVFAFYTTKFKGGKEAVTSVMLQKAGKSFNGRATLMKGSLKVFSVPIKARGLPELASVMQTALRQLCGVLFKEDGPLEKVQERVDQKILMDSPLDSVFGSELRFQLRTMLAFLKTLNLRTDGSFTQDIEALAHLLRDRSSLKVSDLDQLLDLIEGHGRKLKDLTGLKGLERTLQNTRKIVGV